MQSPGMSVQHCGGKVWTIESVLGSSSCFLTPILLHPFYIGPYSAPAFQDQHFNQKKKKKYELQKYVSVGIMHFPQHTWNLG